MAKKKKKEKEGEFLGTVMINDYLNCNWMQCARKIEKCKTERGRQKLIEYYESIPMVEITPEQFRKDLEALEEATKKAEEKRKREDKSLFD